MVKVLSIQLMKEKKVCRVPGNKRITNCLVSLPGKIRAAHSLHLAALCFFVLYLPLKTDQTVSNLLALT